MLFFFIDVVAAAVLSGNRNFEGRVHPLTRANYLASPPLVVAYALAGTVSQYHLVHCRDDLSGFQSIYGFIEGSYFKITTLIFSRLTLILRKSPLVLERMARKFTLGIYGPPLKKLHRYIT